MDDILVVATEEIVLRTADGTYRIRHIPSWRNPTVQIWRVEKVDEHGHWWPINPNNYDVETGLYRWPNPERYM